ncbi:MAG TPA: hypothetical protein PLZ16_12860, partial [Gammaproteobacteria bacterium]|nr:hypothetical protein [Gammaproteobacteria bacterium]
GQLEKAVNFKRIAEQVYRPELYRQAVAELALDFPVGDYKDEGVHPAPWRLEGDQGDLVMGPDLFFDGARFTASDPVAYLEGQSFNHRTVDLQLLPEANPIDAPGRKRNRSVAGEEVNR